MIGGLQGEFGDLDIKYLKQNIPKYLKNVGRKYQEASGEHRGTVQNGCETLRVSAVKGSGHVCPGNLKRPPLPSDCEIFGCKISAHEIPDVKCQRTEFWM